MKKYLVFCGMKYYPAGGMNDFIGSSNSIDEAGISIGNFIRNDNNNEPLHELLEMYWFHIFDTEKMKIVFDESNEIGSKLVLTE